MELLILDRTKAGKVIHKRPDLTHLVCISDPEDSIGLYGCGDALCKPASGSYKHPAKHKLFLEFEDIEETHPRGPQPNHIKALIEFAKTIDDQSKVLVHCWAGVSRSTASAYILLCEVLKDPVKAITEVVRVRKVAQPNTKMLAMYDELGAGFGRLLLIGSVKPVKTGWGL